MSDKPVDFDDHDIDMGEPVTDKLNVLLEELSGYGAEEEESTDLGEPVTDKLTVLLDALPEHWDKEDDETDLSEPVTDRLNQLLAGLPGDDFSARVRNAAELNKPADGAPGPRRTQVTGFWGLIKAFFGRPE